ncbi:NAD(P)/FAD-dependent oxidoreductase [Tuwongella immobilis]|uniref:FAD-binding domain-containing protein n=1 Tax=Tuwongella immobilis TaxID=692036 RepID=A0A6C2YUD2_9BACT|nr:NAD(P)/FAD-dependent oxidoreductase [Tuwongella immobilis]VIP05044.1 tryptophan halogenase : Alkylhalidase OS=uncultured planctomycete GN=HGMM_F11G08C14 PE=4 SV=1: FAD_binding_3 [Tuwongella immobilis]VTS07444.1 tryptophan halogenase : Alkylhalidase OS=uncultured planctomycete GN=HGMM_F11G08C14 PE=4 SV=1: FAD_binding_3 [Tuwongella immobilis]
MTANPEVVVIGGGPAGASAATVLAQNGHRVRLYEREKFPRFHVGESLMPDTYWVLHRLGMLDKMKSSDFVRKYSVQFVTDTGKESQPFYFFENNPHECSQTWQVVRSEFDHLMLQNAASHGVDVREETRVLDVYFDGERATGLKVQNPDGTTEEVFPKVIIDGSGQSSIISNRLKLRQPDAKLRKASVWSYFEDARREPNHLDEGSTLVLQTKGKKGWFWYIPQHNNIVSVGVVSDLENLFPKGERRSLEEIFAEEVANCPAVARRIEGSKRVTDFYTTKDFSYRSSRVAGPGWVLVGDAFGFLDPIYSSGLQLAFRSGLMAADAVSEGLKNGDTSEAQLGSWGPEFLKGMDRLKRLVYSFYEGFNFGTFVRKFPQHKRHITDLLIGDVFKDSLDEVWEPMEIVQAEIREKELMMANEAAEEKPVALC